MCSSDLELDSSTLKKLNTLDTSDPADRLAAGVFREALEMNEADYSANEHLRSIRIIAGDVDAARSVFDLMPTETASNWETIADRLSQVPAAFDGMCESWKLGIERGAIAQRRQVLAVSEQLAVWAGLRGNSGFFDDFVSGAANVAGAPVERLKSLASQASQALARTSAFLERDYAPRAEDRNGVGPERHALALRRFMGMAVDARDAYEWGTNEVLRLDAELSRVAGEIKPGATLDEVRHELDNDPAKAVHGEEQLRDWLQELMDDAMGFLIDNQHFDIPNAIRRVEDRKSTRLNSSH